MAEDTTATETRSRRASIGGVNNGRACYNGIVITNGLMVTLMDTVINGGA